jgi:phage terminase large subunit-like protein
MVYDGVVSNEEEETKPGEGDTKDAKVPSRLRFEYDVLVWCWCPKENAKTRQEKDGIPYMEWAARGQIELTPGDYIDHSRIRNVALRANELYDIREIAHDPWNAAQIAVELSEAGITMVEFRQILSKFAAPTAYTEVLVNKGKLHHGDHPVLRFCASNVQVIVNANGDKRPAKDKSKEKIDLIVALIMGVGRAMLHEGEGYSVYENNDVIVG